MTKCKHKYHLLNKGFDSNHPNLLCVTFICEKCFKVRGKLVESFGVTPQEYREWVGK